MECADSRHVTLCDADSRGFIVVAFCSAILHHWMCKIPTEVATLTPEELEADRWLAMLALHNESLPVCIIDCGARITIDLLNNLGQHIGGLSFAGLKQLHLAAAQARGQKLTEFLGDDQQGFAEDSFLATNPRDAVLAGSFYSVVATLDRVAQDLQEAFQEGEGLRFVLTGGDAEQLQELLGFATDYRPELIFEGMLAYLQKKNQKKLAV
ncbi:Type III pantothenate kinase [Piscirickettsia salmonis]|nr:Type III pantothenate kinase [Piscirickettsia salmonis]